MNNLKSYKEEFKHLQFPKHIPLNLRDFISVDLIDDLGLQLLYKMLEYDPKNRITAKQALQDPYFNKYDEPFVTTPQQQI